MRQITSSCNLCIGNNLNEKYITILVISSKMMLKKEASLLSFFLLALSWINSILAKHDSSINVRLRYVLFLSGWNLRLNLSHTFFSQITRSPAIQSNAADIFNIHSLRMKMRLHFTTTKLKLLKSSFVNCSFAKNVLLSLNIINYRIMRSTASNKNFNIINTWCYRKKYPYTLQHVQFKQ